VSGLEYPGTVFIETSMFWNYLITAYILSYISKIIQYVSF